MLTVERAFGRLISPRLVTDATWPAMRPGGAGPRSGPRRGTQAISSNANTPGQQGKTLVRNLELRTLGGRYRGTVGNRTLVSAE